MNFCFWCEGVDRRTKQRGIKILHGGFCIEEEKKIKEKSCQNILTLCEHLGHPTESYITPAFCQLRQK
jgi:hypothetical protein